jgi:hypothetical protein
MYRKVLSAKSRISSYIGSKDRSDVETCATKVYATRSLTTYSVVYYFVTQTFQQFYIF